MKIDYKGLIIQLSGFCKSLVILMVGLGLIADPTGIVASALFSVRRQQEQADDQPDREK